MKQLKRLAVALAFILALAVTVPAGVGTQTGLVTAAQAAVKISSAKKTLAVGMTATLKVKGTSKKAKWSSSNSSIVSVNSAGKIRARKPGTATITAKVGSKKLKCKVAVKRNYMKLSGGSVARRTGFYDVSQSGGYLASINVMPTYLEYLANGSLKIEFMLYNFSGTMNWTSIKKLRGLYIATKEGKVLVNMDPVILTNAFSLNHGVTKYLTLTIPAKNVKRVVNLNKAGGISYAVDIYLNDAWY